MKPRWCQREGMPSESGATSVPKMKSEVRPVVSTVWCGSSRMICHADDIVEEVARGGAIRDGDREMVEGEGAEGAGFARQRLGVDDKRLRAEVRDRLADEHVRVDDLILRRADAQAMAAPQLRRDGVLQCLVENIHRLQRRRELLLPDAEGDVVGLFGFRHHPFLMSLYGLR